MKKLILLLLPILAIGQVTVVQAPVPKFRSFLPSGSPNVGGCVYTFASGTSSPQATYVDFNGITANSNPVILDANGEAPIWITGTTYRFQVWSFGSGVIGSNCGNGTQLYQIDGVRDTGLNALNGPITIAPTSNGIDIFDLIRATDVSPSGNFVNFKSFAGATLFKVDINGNMTASGNATASMIILGSAADTGLSRTAAGVIRAGNGTQGDSSGTLVATNFLGNLFGMGASVGGDDVALSRISAGVAAIGSGSAGDFSGTLKDTITNSVTGYQVNGAAPNGHCLIGNGTNYVDGNCGIVLQTLLDQTVTGTIMTNVTGISFTAAANTNYRVTCSFFATAVTGGSGQFQWTGPAAPTAVIYNGSLSSAAATAFSSIVVLASSTGVINQNIITMGLLNGANAGTVQMQMNNNTGGDGVTTKAGSYCIVQ